MFNNSITHALQSASGSALGSFASAPLADALAAFSSAIAQTNRLLRLHTCIASGIGPDVLLPESFKAIEVISGSATVTTSDAATLESLPATGFTLQIDALSTNAHLELKALMGQPILLELLTDQSRTQLRPFHGYVTAAQCVGSNGGFARYRFVVQPWLAFLGAGRDSAVFQQQSALQIVQSILSDYQNNLRGQMNVSGIAWRLDVKDPSAYPVRSLSTQYQESDLQFIERLLAEEGLFYWFEHSADPTSPSLGSHTLVIADHNGAFKPNARAQIRFSQSKGTIADDTIDCWSNQRQWHTHAVELASWDYRRLNERLVCEHTGSNTQGSAYVPARMPALISQDTPGAYAYESTAEGQRLAQNHLQALAVTGYTISAYGSVRALAPASTFELTEHASTDLTAQQHVVLRVMHTAKNNLSAQINSHAQFVAQSIPSAIDICASRYEINSKTDPVDRQQSNPGDDIFYRNAALVLPITVPYRSSSIDGHGQRIHPKPRVSANQTALVIGAPDQYLSTDRDHRVKVQFAWQRGERSASRLSHPTPEGHSGAPAQDAPNQTTGTWVRVAASLAPIAGANWGSVALPRIGQEVLVTFLDGDIDRPVIIGSVYNGQGQDDQQSNQRSSGAANATGNAPAWFPGSQQADGQGLQKGVKLPGHQHQAVLSGIKTQSMSNSQTGLGGYNQLVFDDTPGQSRLALQQHSPQEGGKQTAGSHSGTNELNLGSLRQQTDNQRLAATGYGFELKTQHSGALRAGSGIYLTAHARTGDEAGNSHQLDTRETDEQLSQSYALIKALTDTAQQHRTGLPVKASKEEKPKELAELVDAQKSKGNEKQLPVFQQLAQLTKSLAATDARGERAAQERAAEEQQAQEETYDEQIQFVNTNGAPLANVKYTLLLADASSVQGVTDKNGMTQRVVTDSPQAITEATADYWAIKNESPPLSLNEEKTPRRCCFV